MKFKDVHVLTSWYSFCMNQVNEQIEYIYIYRERERARERESERERARDRERERESEREREITVLYTVLENYYGQL